MDFVFTPNSLACRQLRSGGGRSCHHALCGGQLPPSSCSIDVCVRLGPALTQLHQQRQSLSIFPACLVAKSDSLQAHQSSSTVMDSSEASLASSHHRSPVATGGHWLRLLLCTPAYLLCDILYAILLLQSYCIEMAIYH